jgi:hypothetical protein
MPLYAVPVRYILLRFYVTLLHYRFEIGNVN